MDLDALKDIHLPPDPGIWPPAIGWWLCVIGITLVALMMPRIRLAVRRYRARRRTLKRLHEITTRAVDSADNYATAELALLLRQVAVRRFPSHHCAALTGDDWLEFLSQTGDGIDFRSVIGRRLLDAPYQPRQDADTGALVDLADRWIRRNA